MPEVVIRVEGLSKKYIIGHQRNGSDGLRHVLQDTVTAPFRWLRSEIRNPQSAIRNSSEIRNPQSTIRNSSEIRNPQSAIRNSSEVFWALKDVSFEVIQGEVVGIIGRNGAGKSTLLKILSRITEPTVGRVGIRGRVASLLEVGTGFHPELTGRENVFLNGAILGMTREEIKRKFDEIVAFAEVEKFLDTPVKRYSSGMYVRLAFAVAAHLEPEILIVDEVLAVGDAQFQKKCLGKMGEVSREGRTVLFVSHNMTAVQSLCNRTIWLEAGRAIENGPSKQIVSNYLKTALSPLTEQVWNDIETAPGCETVKLHRACVRPENGSPQDSITVQTPFLMEFEYWNLDAGSHLNLSLHLYNSQGTIVFNAVPLREPVWHGRPFPTGLFRSTCYAPGDLMNDGTYRVEILVVKNEGTIIYRCSDVLVFDVLEAPEKLSEWYGGWPGAVRPALNWSTELIGTEEPSRDEALALRAK